MRDIIDRFMAVYPEHHKVNPYCVRYEHLRAENEKLRLVLKEAAKILAKAAGKMGAEEFADAAIVCAAAAALKETGDE